MARHFLIAVTSFAFVALVVGRPAVVLAQVQTPEQFFGFKIGTDGEFARYPKVLEYMQHLAKATAASSTTSSARRRWAPRTCSSRSARQATSRG